MGRAQGQGRGSVLHLPWESTDPCALGRGGGLAQGPGPGALPVVRLPRGRGAPRMMERGPQAQ